MIYTAPFLKVEFYKVLWQTSKSKKTDSQNKRSSSNTRKPSLTGRQNSNAKIEKNKINNGWYICLCLTFLSSHRYPSYITFCKVWHFSLILKEVCAWCMAAIFLLQLCSKSYKRLNLTSCCHFAASWFDHQLKRQCRGRDIGPHVEVKQHLITGYLLLDHSWL